LSIAVFVLAVLAPSVRMPPKANVAAPAAPYDVAADKTLLLRPVGGLTEADVDFLARGLSARLGLTVGLMAPSPLPGRRQPGAAVSGKDVIDWLFATRPQGSWRVLAVVPNDIVEGDLENIYGMASTRDSVAVVSIAAFASDLAASDPRVRATAQDQVIRAATHELVHTLGIDHCANSRCLMSAITDRSQIRRDTAPCERCAKAVQRSLRAARDPQAERVQEADGWFHRGGYARALEGYQQALKPGGTTAALSEAELENRVGAALISMERVVEGETHVRRALELAPDLAPVHYNMALVDAYAGRYTESYASLTRGMACDPSPTSRHGFAGRFHIEVMEDPTRAISELVAYRRAGGHDPHLLDALDALEGRDVVVFEPQDVETILGRVRR
jgi:predicted Zn-dependent protease